MAISLMITLSGSEWISEIGGWRCEALKIPGARIEAVYAEGSRLDSAWYHVDEVNSVLRWSRDSAPPARATASVVLDKQLSSQEVTARWKKLSILMPLITAVATAFIGYAVHKASRAEPPAPQDKYSIQGTVNLKSDGRQFAYEKIQLCMRPPDLIVYPDGSFKGEVSVCLDKDGKLTEIPKLVIESGQKEYMPAVVHLLNEGEKAPLGVTDYDVEVKPEKRLIKVRKPVEFVRSLSQGYYPSTQQTPEAVDSDGRPRGSK
jgi:hypothetical protein